MIIVRNRYIVSLKYKIAFYEIPKTGIHTILRHVCEMELGEIKIPENKSLSPLRNSRQMLDRAYSIRFRRRIPPLHYKRYCFVRNPFSRIYGSYNMIVSEKKAYQQNINKDCKFDILYKNNIENIEVQDSHGNFLEFNEFVKHQLKKVITNIHFSPFKNNMLDILKPVTLYKTENMNQSLDIIFKEIGYTPYSHYRMNQLNSDNDYQSKYNEESISIIEKLYEWDLNKLGYNFHGSTKNLGIPLSDL